MLRVGILLIIIGASSYLLPMIGMQNRLIAAFPPEVQPFIGGAVIGVGVILSLIGLKSGKKKGEKK
jgi:hypothetical protein